MQTIKELNNMKKTVLVCMLGLMVSGCATSIVDDVAAGIIISGVVAAPQPYYPPSPTYYRRCKAWGHCW